MRLSEMLNELQAAGDWRGIVALERSWLVLARELQGANPEAAGAVLNVLGLGFCETGQYARAREMHEQAKAIAEEAGDRAGVAQSCGNLGSIYGATGDNARAREMHEQAMAIEEELGDRAGLAESCGNLGNCYFRTGYYTRAREMHEQHKSIAEEVGDRKGVAMACGNLGNCYLINGDYGRAREMHEQAKAMAEELGDRIGLATSCGNLGNCYYRAGDYVRAREMYEQDQAICEELEDRAGVAGACANLGNCHCSMGDYGRACGMHEQYRAVCEELGDRTGVVTACFNLGACYLSTGEYARAISYFTETYNMAKELKLWNEQAEAALGMGVALRLEVRANVRGRAADASELPRSYSSASACGDDGAREAQKWLQTALDGGIRRASLHLAHLAFDAGQEETALAHLKDYLSWHVELGRNWCVGCHQKRGEDAQMLTCGGCRVARFCSADHQKLASKSVASGGTLLLGRHKDVCGVLGKWRQVVKDGLSPDSCSADLLAFLQQ